MNKAILAFGTLAILGFAQPAPAQMMCGSGQQAQAQAPAQRGMMCGMMGQAAQDDRTGDKPAQSQRQRSGMCPMMAMMMRGGVMGGSGGRMQQDHSMPGMETPQPQPQQQQ